MRLIELDALVAELDRRIEGGVKVYRESPSAKIGGLIQGYKNAKQIINTLEVKEVDWNMLSELSRHLLAVEAHNVTPNYQGRELDLLERIGYPERFKAQKGEDV